MRLLCCCCCWLNLIYPFLPTLTIISVLFFPVLSLSLYTFFRNSIYIWGGSDKWTRNPFLLPYKLIRFWNIGLPSSFHSLFSEEATNILHHVLLFITLLVHIFYIVSLMTQLIFIFHHRIILSKSSKKKLNSFVLLLDCKEEHEELKETGIELFKLHDWCTHTSLLTVLTSVSNLKFAFRLQTDQNQVSCLCVTKMWTFLDADIGWSTYYLPMNSPWKYEGNNKLPHVKIGNRSLTLSYFLN